ncbi:uncharacterized protein LOC121002590 [Bufo bufo]|uniref:uncharacterized protein LOC121002590 n=1 Tax=Bufo bufo TaxID=8384 RepID=UPI001ABEE65D|nr:uncharacterized protein LOC121002590 [Bufo bufo]
MSGKGSVCDETPQHASHRESQDEDPEFTALTKRSVKPTWKVKENYESMRTELATSLKQIWDKILTHIDVISCPSHEVLQLEGAIKHLSASYELYQTTSNKYKTILQSINTEESLEQLNNAQLLNEERESFIQRTKAKAEAKLLLPRDTVSHKSVSTRRSKGSSRSRSSRHSTLSEQLMNARAEAEAIKIRAAYAKKRADMEAEVAVMEAEAAHQKAAIEAQTARQRAAIEALKEQSNYEAAAAKLKVLEQAIGADENASERVSVKADVEDPFERTKNYVLNHSSEHSITSTFHGNARTSPHHQVKAVPATSYMQTHPSAAPDCHADPAYVTKRHTNPQASRQPPANSTVPDLHPTIQLNALAAPYLPTSLCNDTINNAIHNNQPATSYVKSEATDTTEVVKYLLRHELAKSGLVNFDDHPENYRSWKAAFKTTLGGIGFTADRELDLLIGLLGPQSTERVKSLRSVYIDNPTAGLTAAWERLEQTYGSPEAIENALLKRLENFPRISGKDNIEFQRLSDLLLEVQLAKTDPKLPGLSYLDTARGVNPIVCKLPHGLQEKWIQVGSSYKRENKVSFPPFSYFCNFVRNIADTKNDPSFAFSEFNTPSPKGDNLHTSYRNRRGPVSVRKTDIIPTPAPNKSGKIENPNRLCPIHKKPHPLKKCIGFRKKPLQERKELLKTFGVCYRCCASTDHFAKECKTPIKCIECGSEDHVQALHPLESNPSQHADLPPGQNHSGKSTDHVPNSTMVFSSCTVVCGEDHCDKSCAKICLVNIHHKDQPEKTLRVYAILDDQSNRSLARSELFDLFCTKREVHPYTLGTCSGTTEVFGRRAHGFIVSSLENNLQLPLPTLVECNQIPANKEEIPTPEVAFYHPHLRSIASEIPPLDKDAKILLLLGRDILRIHKTNVLPNGRNTHFEPCPHHYWVKEKVTSCKLQHRNTNLSRTYDDSFGSTVFNVSSEDDKLAPSAEDKEFLKVMDNEFFQEDSNGWVAPLPFRLPREKLPNNLHQAVKRFSSLKRTLSRKPEMERHFVDFIQNIFDRGHAEPAPPLKEGEECWYLPSFGVYHPRKPDQIRVVFDSSAQHEGFSLNDMLLTGPNLNNNLIGVLIRFRQEPVAVMADIQQMFHCFIVKEDNRNYLRFLWHKDNDINKEVIDYRMRVHVFGNSPSPAVAIYGLKKTAQLGEAEYGSDARQFVERNFYVDDGLKSFPTAKEAINLLTRTKEMLAVANLRLHKIISNSQELMNAFHPEDYAASVKDLDLGSDTPPMQRSLGLLWNIKVDTFTFQVSTCDKPFTKRGVLSVVNSIYDPLGFIAPVTIQGKMLLRQLTTDNIDWDTPLPIEKQQRWEKWRGSLKTLEQLQIPRCYAPVSISAAVQREIHIFSDASVEAIAAVAYLKTSGVNGVIHCNFVLGKTKLTPKPAHTIPRLELCAAVLAVEIAEVIKSEMDINIDSFTFYTDSKIVLGYIYNQTKQFYVYVSNRVERIRRFSLPKQWHHIPTDLNPADCGTRAISPVALLDCLWLSPPRFLSENSYSIPTDTTYELVHPDDDKEIRSMYTTLCTSASSEQKLKSHRFERFSTWSSAVRTVAYLIHIAHCFKRSSTSECHGWHICTNLPTATEIEQAERVIIRCVQQEVYMEELHRFKGGIPLSKGSSLFNLNPVVDDNQLLRVGACKELQLDNFLANNGCTWLFNSPHSSHMGGSWERMIGIARRILDSMLQDHKSSLFTHETLSTFLSEVSAIINARPLVPVSSDPDAPMILTPATLLTQKVGTTVISSAEIDPKDIYRRQWKRVQHLANVFWHRWRKEYLHTLQSRSKWQTPKPNLKVGDLVLLKDREVCRNEWPMGLVTSVMPSDDGKVRKVEIKITKGGSARTFSRPITELVLLLPSE